MAMVHLQFVHVAQELAKAPVVTLPQVPTKKLRRMLEWIFRIELLRWCEVDQRHGLARRKQVTPADGATGKFHRFAGLVGLVHVRHHRQTHGWLHVAQEGEALSLDRDDLCAGRCWWLDFLIVLLRGCRSWFTNARHEEAA